MASISTSSDGRRTIQFKASNGTRKSVRLGKVSQRQAESVRGKVEDLANASITGEAARPATAQWVAELGDDLHKRLAKVGLVEPRGSRDAATLGKFTTDYIASRTDVKPRTVINLKRAADAMVEYFGAKRSLASITSGDADSYRLHLLGKGLAENTVRRLCGRARQFMHVALRRKIIEDNPFLDMPCSVGSDHSRFRFVTRDEIEAVLAACPDAEWRAIFALSRYGGLRCTSEHLALQWADIDWEHNRMNVRSPKTEHFEGKASRPVPLFPELRPYLLDLFHQCEDGTKHVINRYRDRNSNLRTQANRIIRLAGLEPWPKTFHNLRASLQTELADRFPAHVVCEWIGNSQQVAAKHYLHVIDEHWTRAIEEVEAVQNPVQQVHASNRTTLQGVHADREESTAMQGVAEPCGSVHDKGIPPSGLEPETR